MAKGKAGRPRIEFDLTVVEGLGEIGATLDEMATVLPASRATIAARMGDKDSDFWTAYNKGFGDLRMSLRREQIRQAKGGNITMLIWLGKQLLEQRDRHDVSGLSATAVLVTEARAKSDEMTDDEAREILAQAARGPVDSTGGGR